jgi:hypothetical protein
MVSEKSPNNYLSILSQCTQGCIKGEEVDAYIVSCNPAELINICKFDWVIMTEVYSSYMICTNNEQKMNNKV